MPSPSAAHLPHASEAVPAATSVLPAAFHRLTASSLAANLAERG